ncbi:uncharacterized protein EURHEDRAFT_361308 [Aspergillus ruber CBS 135680]|uniref:Uncharacterized protein n=1 Tax=Aspergillus ruber (strain CBS 135680) TaxID=1388766 RepID=A0A017SII7_ASPRC|nr:uncharacterized protein EURHEDRAFT_361308 [Aspergillus ruber CBS 135680]EYE96095.1 hypothetical protein EURHEDRAFT_361308 [Aspergillus ruber CBS 135680]
MRSNYTSIGEMQDRRKGSICGSGVTEASLMEFVLRVISRFFTVDFTWKPHYICNSIIFIQLLAPRLGLDISAKDTHPCRVSFYSLPWKRILGQRIEVAFALLPVLSRLIMSRLCYIGSNRGSGRAILFVQTGYSTSENSGYFPFLTVLTLARSHHCF